MAKCFRLHLESDFGEDRVQVVATNDGHDLSLLIGRFDKDGGWVGLSSNEPDELRRLRNALTTTLKFLGEEP